ncbi:MAG TPA: sigma-70 family RNA polymerase sigma factor [Nocardioides sp.]|uniref:RNA polymerase sigma factor n=1 Tax=Nocardioides sp. TaxID=35761 RepID=UPI002C53E5D3|nr:sigma-70 family RNA polymerase sigma factor [Nocardioides sp.]HQR27862.1 sigma-70 family RNA polymerase sigma factor [Nocardioides sp.]
MSPDQVADQPRGDRNGAVWGQAAACFRRWLDGDQGGLDDLVRLMTPVLWHVVRAYRLSPEVAEDVLQTTWLALVRRRDSIQDSVAVGGWLTTTARREAWRVGQKVARDVPVDDQEFQVALPTQRSAEADAVEHDEQQRLWLAVGTLDERCQRLLRIVAFEHRPDYRTVASTLDMPVGSIGPTRSRCLAKLRVALTVPAAATGTPDEGGDR